jgi:aspartyl/asparaginyl beta-hydroxylase (cupin superfamily)
LTLLASPSELSGFRPRSARIEHVFLEPRTFPFVAPLESSWRVVRSELERLKSEHFLPWPERFLYGEGWDVFGLWAFGERLDANCRLCPETARLVEAIPGMTTAGFSSLVAGTHIQPHVGYTSAVLRCHLGLIVPPGCELRVGDVTRSWEEGKCLLFDDTVDHEAWNRGDATRVVLLIDFLRPATDVSGAP